MKKYNILIAFFVFFTVFASFSQNHKGALDTISQDGFHKLMLTPEMRAATNENFNYLRIIDAQKLEIPYVLIYNTDKSFSIFNSIKITSNTAIKDSITAIIIENSEGLIEETLTLQIANTNSYKNYSISGSDNKLDWFGLVSNRTLTALSSSTKTAVEKTIFFPLNNYKYLRIIFNDKNSLPIKILDVGVYKSGFFIQNLIEVDGFSRETISDKNRKVTQLTFKSEKAHRIDRISFKINTEFFLRNVKVIVKKTHKVNKQVEIYDQVVDEFQLNSKNKNTFVLNALHEKEFRIEIENQDNPPLVVESIQLYQKPIFLVANLKQNKKYELMIDHSLKKPSYDLGNFISNKTDAIDDVFVPNFSKVKRNKESLKTPAFWETTIFMWLCIVLGAFLIVYFALGLLKDLNREGKT